MFPAIVNKKSKRKVLLACRQWGSEESIHAWKFLKSHVLQVACIIEIIFFPISSLGSETGLHAHLASCLAARSCSAAEAFILKHLQARDGVWDDEIVVVHIMNKKDKEKERWDQGGATIPSLSTALEPYQHDVFDLEVCVPTSNICISHKATCMLTQLSCASCIMLCMLLLTVILCMDLLLHTGIA
jgi:hypothetical protein